MADRSSNSLFLIIITSGFHISNRVYIMRMFEINQSLITRLLFHDIAVYIQQDRFSQSQFAQTVFVCSGITDDQVDHLFRLQIFL